MVLVIHLNIDITENVRSIRKVKNPIYPAILLSHYTSFPPLSMLEWRKFDICVLHHRSVPTSPFYNGAATEILMMIVKPFL